jgi:hypothetical protein
VVSLLPLFGAEIVFIIVKQNAVCWAFQIVKLIIFNRPEKCPDGEAQKNQ